MWTIRRRVCEVEKQGERTNLQNQCEVSVIEDVLFALSLSSKKGTEKHDLFRTIL
jgi:hypothetical protein